MIVASGNTQAWSEGRRLERRPEAYTNRPVPPQPLSSTLPPAQPYYRRSPTADEMMVDGLFFRPFKLIETALGTGVFILTLPFSALGGNSYQAAQKLVVEPANSAFRECLGCLPPRYLSNSSTATYPYQSYPSTTTYPYRP